MTVSCRSFPPDSSILTTRQSPTMVFLSICTALYDYVPQSDAELAIKEGELIYVLEKSGEDDWWKAKKRAPGEADDEPVGLIPNNYVEEVSTDYRWILVFMVCLAPEVIMTEMQHEELPLI